MWKPVSKYIRDRCKSLFEKADEVTKVGRLKLEIIAVKRDIEKKFIELGGKIYHIKKSSEKIDIFNDEVFKPLFNEISEHEKKLDHLKNKLEQIKKEDGVNLD